MRHRATAGPRTTLTLFCLLALQVRCVWALDLVTFEVDGKTRQVAGRILVEAQDGGLLLEGTDRHIWTLLPEQIQLRGQDATEFRYRTRAELAASLLDELPEGFRIHNTVHYLICYDTSPAYAQWCGALFEKLHRAFFNFWGRQGVVLTEPDVLVALIFTDRGAYAAYGQGELGEGARSVIGFYSLATNRITTYDLTGIEQGRNTDKRQGMTRRMNQILRQPAAARTVATVIHEATHQLAFNSGLQRRFADNPLWLSEGLAIYFETPDVTSSRGWRKIGGLHATRLKTMRDYLPTRPRDSLFTLLTDDGRFRDTQQAETAYAEAWSLCFFLMRQRPEQFAAYLRLIAEKPILGEDTAEQRLQDFVRAFGQDWREIDAALLRSLPTWR